MGVGSTSWQQVHPSRIEPGVLMQINQFSGAPRVLAGGAPRVILDPEDLYIYMKKLTMRSRVSGSQTAANMLPGASLMPGYISTPAYRLRCHAEWDHHDANSMARWGVNIVEGYRLANRQGIFQAMRNMLLYGMVPANGEGVLNTAGATTTNLPADPFGATTVSTYDPGAMAVFILSVLLAAKVRTYQLGTARRWVILGPQEDFGIFEMTDIVQLTSFQRLGGGSATTAGVIKDVAEKLNGDSIEWCYDDTLIGKGAGGTNAWVIIMPEVDQPTGQGIINTNEFAGLEPNMDKTSLMYSDMAAPMEITVPLALGAVDTLYEIRNTCGWITRPEALTVVSAAH